MLFFNIKSYRKDRFAPGACIAVAGVAEWYSGPGTNRPWVPVPVRAATFFTPHLVLIGGLPHSILSQFSPQSQLIQN